MGNENLGPKIKRFRKENKITQEKLAEALGYSHKSVITHIEKGEADMSIEKLLLFLRTYSVDANDFLEVKRLDKLIEENKRYEIERNNIRKNDVLFKVNKTIFSYRVGGVLIKDRNIMLTKNAWKYTIPGGHVKIGEESKDAVIREFKEETLLDIEPLNVMATFENFWMTDDKQTVHEITILYKVKLIDDKQEIIPNPDQRMTQFVWVDINELDKIDLYPKEAIDIIKKGTVDNNHFIIG